MTTYPIAQDQNDYGDVFQQNVVRSLQAVLTRAEGETGAALSATLRARVEAVLTYAFETPAGWPLLRLLLRRLTPRFNLAGAWAVWAPYLEKGLAACEVRADAATRAALLADLGLLNQRLSRLAVAEAQLAEAATLARAQGDQDLLGLALQRRAEVARLERRYDACAALLAEAGTLFTTDATAQAPVLFVAGKAAFDQHDLAAATAAFTQAMKLWEIEGNSGRVAVCVQNLGRIAAAQGELSTAIRLYEEAIDLLVTAGDLSSLAVVQMNLGVAYYEARQYDQALTLYQIAEVHFQTMSDFRSLAMVYNNLGLIYTALEEWAEAEIYLQCGITVHQQVGDVKSQINTKGNLGIAYLKQTRYAQAIQIFQDALVELQTTNRDPEYERLWREITKYLTQAEEHYQARKKR
ncbi:MAG: tetratricopeptide repeat protein [Caldilineaceae bacterium]